MPERRPDQRDQRGALRASARRISAFCAHNAAAIDREGAFPREEFALLAAEGLLTAPLAPALGGADLRLAAGSSAALNLLLLLKEIGRGSLPVGRLYEGHVNALELAQIYGSPEQIERWATEARAGLRFACWAADDPDDPLRLLPDARGGELRGVKNFCSGAGVVERALVTAALPDGTRQMLLLPMEAESARVDLGWWQPLGMRASATARVDFGGLRVRREQFLGAPDDYVREPHFRGGAVRFAAVHAGGAEALFDALRAQVGAQRDDPLVQMRVAELAIAVESCTLWLRGAAAAWGAADAGAERLAVYADLTRSAVLECCSRVLSLAERALGATAFLRPRPFERLTRDLTMYLRQPAPDHAFTRAGLYALAAERPAAELWSDGDA